MAAAKRIDLDSYFPFFLGTLSNRWIATSSRIYLQKFGVGVGEWRVLASIDALGRASANEVVRLISMDAGAVSRSMARLEKDALVVPVAGKFTGRTKPYELTRRGRALYMRILRIALKREDTLLGALSPEERRTLVALMRKVMTRMERL